MALSFDPSKVIALVPYQDRIDPDTNEALFNLQRLGVSVWRNPGCSAIDFARNQMLSKVYLDGMESIIFIDSDIGFSPVDAEYLLKRPEPVVAGLYCQKGTRRLAANLPDWITDIPCGERGVDILANGVGAGFLRIRREAITAMLDALDLPACTHHGDRLWPFFLPLVKRLDDGTHSYEGEDFAFCTRCREAGIPVILDTRPVLYHWGRWAYGVANILSSTPPMPTAFTIKHRGYAPQR